MVFAIKILLNNAYGLLNLLEFICNHFNSLFQAESEYKNSNFGGKSSEILIQCLFPKKFDFRAEAVTYGTATIAIEALVSMYSSKKQNLFSEKKKDDFFPGRIFRRLATSTMLSLFVYVFESHKKKKKITIQSTSLISNSKAVLPRQSQPMLITSLITSSEWVTRERFQEVIFKSSTPHE